MERKNTILVYRDDDNLAIYDSLEPALFKEFFMKYFKYRSGDTVNSNDFSNPLLFSIFKLYQSKIDANENKWLKKAKTAAENGKKGGRPKKEETIKEEEPQVENDFSGFLNPHIVDSTKKYYKYDTNHSQSINSMIESNKGSLSLSAVRNSIINEIEKDGWELKDAKNIYEEIIMGINR